MGTTTLHGITNYIFFHPSPAFMLGMEIVVFVVGLGSVLYTIIPRILRARRLRYDDF